MTAHTGKPASPLPYRLKNAWTLIICSILNGHVLFLPTLALYYQNQLGSVQLASTVFAVEAIAIVLTEVPSGAAADLFGRKQTLIIAQLSVLLSYISLYYGGGYGVFTGALLAAFSQSFNSGTSEAIMYDSLMTGRSGEEAENEYRWYSGWYGTGWPVGAAIGSLLGAYLAEYDLSLPIIMTCVPVGISTLLMAFMVTEPPYEKHTHGNVWKQMVDGWGTIMANRNLLKLLSAKAAIDGIGEPVHYMDAMYYTSLGAPTRLLGFIGIGVYGMSATGNSISSTVYNKCGYKVTFLGSILFGSCCTLLSTFFANPYVAIPLFVTPSISFGIRCPLFSTLINGTIGSAERATVISFFSLTTQLAIAGFSVLLGWLVDWLGIAVAFRLATCVTFGAVGVLASLPFVEQAKGKAD